MLVGVKVECRLGLEAVLWNSCIGIRILKTRIPKNFGTGTETEPNWNQNRNRGNPSLLLLPKHDASIIKKLCWNVEVK